MDNLEVGKFKFTNYNKKAIEELKKEPRHTNGKRRIRWDRVAILGVATLSTILLVGGVVQGAIHDHNYDEVNHDLLGDFYNEDQQLVHVHDENDVFKTKHGEIDSETLFVADQLQINEASTVADIEKAIENGEYEVYLDTHEIKINKDLQADKVDAEGNPIDNVEYYNEVAIPKAIEYVREMNNPEQNNEQGLSNH